VVIASNYWSNNLLGMDTDEELSDYPDGTFRPNASVTRSEFAAMIGKAFPNAQKSRNPVQFADVPSN